MGANKRTTNGRRRILLIELALVAIVAAMAAGGYIAYRSAQSGDPATTVAHQSGNQPHVRAAVTNSPPSPTPVPTASPVPPFAGQSFRMAIDKIGVDAPVVTE